MKLRLAVFCLAALAATLSACNSKEVDLEEEQSAEQQQTVQKWDALNRQIAVQGQQQLQPPTPAQQQ